MSYCGAWRIPGKVTLRGNWRAGSGATRYGRIYRSDVLWEAWRRPRRNRGVAGVDAETIQALEQRGVGSFWWKSKRHCEQADIVPGTLWVG